MKNIDLTKYQRICILGSSGSGKSTLAIELGKLLSLPVIHMDVEFWLPNWQKSTTKELYDKVTKQMGEKWIIDGNYMQNHQELMELRLKLADLIIFIDMPLDECLVSVTKRKTENQRIGLPSHLVEDDENLQGLIDHIIYWHSNLKPKIFAMIDSHAEDKLAILTRAQINDLLIEHSQ